MDPIITSLSADHVEDDLPSPTYRYRKINVPLAYPSQALKEQTSNPRAYIYPPPMSPSDEFFQQQPEQQQQQRTLPTTSQPINIPQGKSRADQHGRQGGWVGRRNSLPVRSASSLPTTTLISEMEAATTLPSPPTSPWKQTNGFTRPTRSKTMVVDETPYPELPTDVRSWTSSHVAEYLGYSLRLYPRAITEDLGRYVRQSAHLTGAKFLDLQEEDLERMEINLKWRSMIMKAVGMLRRETLRASRIDELNWEDGYNPEKDGPLSRPSSVEDLSTSVHHSASATTASDSTCTTHVQDQGSAIHKDLTVETIGTRQQVGIQEEPRYGIMENLTGALLSWKKEQEEKTIGGLGFMEGVVAGGLIVAFVMKFSR